jgi:protein TonB
MAAAASQRAAAGDRSGWGTGIAVLLLMIGLGLLAWFFWPQGRLPGPERVIQQITLVAPPPPPPEEKIMEQEPEIVDKPIDEPQVQKDVEQPSEAPSETPSEQPSQPSTEAAGLDKPADAGSDNFRLAAGGGGGLFGRGTGGGPGGGSWGAYVETHIRRALQRDSRTRAANGFLNVVVEIDPAGRFTGARLRSTTGDARLDGAVQSVLSALPPLGRGLPADQSGRTYATINMKRIGG